jgi:iron(III) transport system permease protein
MVTLELRTPVRAPGRFLVTARAARQRAAAWHLAPVALVVVLGYLVLAPLIRLQALALDHGARAYHDALHTPEFGKTLETTVVLALGSLALSLVLGTGLALAAERLPRRLGWLGVAPILPIVIPAVAAVTGWAFLLSPRIGYLNAALRHLPFLGGSTGPADVYSVPWIVIITGIGLTAFIYVFVRAGLRSLNSELTEAAHVSGASPIRTFFTVTLPLLRPVLVYGAAIALLLGLGQFTAPLLLGGPHNVNVLTTDMYNYATQPPVNFGIAAALGSPLLLAGLLVVVMQKLALGDESRFVTHGGRAVRTSERRTAWAALPLGLFSLVAIILPLVALFVVSMSPFYSAHIKVATWTLANYRGLFSGLILRAFETSAVASIAGVAVALPVGYMAAAVLHNRRQHGWVAGVLDYVVNLPLGVPAVVFGAGFLFTYIHPPLVLYGTKWVFIVVYVTLMLPYSTRLILAGRVSLGENYVAAARVSGAGPLRTHVQIILPLMRAALGGAAALMLVMLQQEFAASVLVRSGTTQVMGTELFDLWSTSSYPQVAAMALLMCLVTGVGVSIAILLGGRSMVRSA